MGKKSNKYLRKPVKVSIIIPSWFHEEQHGKYGKHETFWFAAECLNKLIARTPKQDYELIIIDNGSTLTDEEVHQTVLEKQYSGWTEDYKQEVTYPSAYWKQADVLIKNKTNLGFGPACNQGFAIARGEYIICLNNDIIVWTNWIDALINIYDQELEPAPGVVMPALMRETKDAKEALKMQSIILKSNLNKFSAGAEFGSLWMMRRSFMSIIKNKYGYIFNENFQLGMGEDRHLWMRVRDCGFETYRTHQTRVFHQGNMTIGKVADRKKYTTDNRKYLRMLEKKMMKENNFPGGLKYYATGWKKDKDSKPNSSLGIEEQKFTDADFERFVKNQSNPEFIKFRQGLSGEFKEQENKGEPHTNY